MAKQKAAPTRYGGKEIYMAGQWWVVPSLSTKDAVTFWDDLAQFQSPGDRAKGKERLQKAIEIIHAAMKRNYPNLTSDEVKDMVGLGDYMKLLTLVFTASGVSETGPEPDGESAEGASSIGTRPTGPSFSEPAGPSNTSTSFPSAAPSA